MKRNIIFFRLALLPLLLFTINSVKSQDRFNTVIMEGGTDVSTYPSGHCIMTSDGGYLISLSNAFFENINQQMTLKYCYSVLEKYDINGNLLWSKEIKDFAIEDMCELRDGSIVVCGEQFLGNLEVIGPRNIYIVKLNPCGDVEWAKVDIPKSHEHLSGLALYVVIDTGDGLIFPISAWGSYREEGGGRVFIDNIDILKLDYDGNTVYRNSFEQYSDGNQFVMGGGIVDSDNNIWMSSVCLAPHPYDYWYSVFSTAIMQCDSEGNLLYAKNAKDEGIDVYGALEPYSRLLMDDDERFFVIQPISFVIEGSRDDYYSTASMITVDRDYDLKTYIINNPDVNEEPKSAKWTEGMAFINNHQHIVTSMHYIRNDVEIGRSCIADMPNLIDNDRNRRFRNTDYSGIRSSKSEDSRDKFLSRLYVLDKEARVVDSLDMDDKLPDFNPGEFVLDIFAVENNNFVTISRTEKADGRLFSSRMRKFNANLEPAFIDPTPREYDTKCGRPITSGVLTPNYEQLYGGTSVDGLRGEVKPLRLLPNPATDKVRIYLSNGFGEKQIDIYDTQGVLKRTVCIDDGWAQHNIDVTDLSAGVYIVKLIVDGKIKGVEKLIVK